MHLLNNKTSKITPLAQELLLHSYENRKKHKGSTHEVRMLTNKVDGFRDAMNATYVPAAVSNNGTDDRQAFMKEFEKKSNQTEKADPVDVSRKAVSNDQSKTNERDELRSGKNRTDNAEKPENRPQHPDREADTRETSNRAEDKRVENKPSQQQVKENGRNDNTNGETKNGKAGQNHNEAIKNIKISNIKEIIQKNQLQTEKLDKATEDVKEKFSEAQRIKSGNNAEKIMLKDLGGGKETSKNTADIEVEDVKHNEESNVEKRQMNGPETEKKDAPPSFKNELNTAKEKTNPDGTFNVGNLNARDNQPVNNEIKIQKMLRQQNIREQYEVIKDNVLNSVDNGIKMMVAEGENRISINLKPPELGKIQVELIVKDNQVSARINTENIAVKEVIMTNLDQLKSNIENAGIAVDKFDVEVGGFRNQFDQQFSGDTSGGKGGGEKKGDGGRDFPRDPDWLPDKIIKQSAYSYFVGRSINYLV